MLLLLLAAGCWPAAQADSLGGAGLDGRACLGRVWHLAGTVEAGSGGAMRTLKEGDAVYATEHVRAQAKSEAVLRTADAGIVAVRPGAEFVVEDYAAQANAGDHMTLRILYGSLRIVSGWIALLNQPGDRVLTPTAIITVHGTDYEPYVLPEDLADATPYEAGTYDKVNRGSTQMDSASGKVEVKTAQVAFAAVPPADDAEHKGKRGMLLAAFLLPSLLDRVPDIYTGGHFDGDIDAYSRQAATLVKSRLAQAQAGGAPTCGGPL